MIDRLINWVGQKPMWMKVVFWLVLGWAVAVVVILAWPVRSMFAPSDLNVEAKEKLKESIKESTERAAVLEKEEEEISDKMEIETNERSDLDKKIDAAADFAAVDRIADNHFSGRLTIKDKEWDDRKHRITPVATVETGKD